MFVSHPHFQWRVCEPSTLPVKSLWAIHTSSEGFLSHPHFQWRVCQRSTLPVRVCEPSTLPVKGLWAIHTSSEEFVNHPHFQWRVCEPSTLPVKSLWAIHTSSEGFVRNPHFQWRSGKYETSECTTIFFNNYMECIGYRLMASALLWHNTNIQAWDYMEQVQGWDNLWLMFNLSTDYPAMKVLNFVQCSWSVLIIGHPCQWIAQKHYSGREGWITLGVMATIYGQPPPLAFDKICPPPP